MRAFLFIISFILIVPSKAQVSFNSLDSVFAYAERNSVVIKTNTQQSLLAKWTMVAAEGNIINFRNPVSFTPTDNTKLPVSFIPASAFGGPSGTLKQITLGQQYVSNFNFNPQIDIINPYNWAKVKSASLNKEMTETQNLLNKKSLFESIAAAFFNVISLQEQLVVMQKNMAASDSLVIIAKDKYTLGQIREQDVNNTVVNQLNVKDKLTQLKITLEQQQNSLKILCDIPLKTNLSINPPEGYSNATYNSELKATSSLSFKNSILQSEYARNELRANRWSTMPILSAVYYQGWQQNSNNSFFDSKSTWIQSQYIGLKLTVPFPTDVTRLSQNYTSKVNYRIAFLNAEHAKLQNDLNNQTLNSEYEKTFSAYVTAKQIYELKNSNYAKSLNQYKEGILSTDIMLSSYADMLNGKINYASAQAALEYAKARITINNLSK